MVSDVVRDIVKVVAWAIFLLPGALLLTAFGAVVLLPMGLIMGYVEQEKYPVSNAIRFAFEAPAGLCGIRL
jgi:hypothetical protein